MPPEVAISVGDLCKREQKHLDDLPRLLTGAVADSYETLHGVRLVRAILSSIPAELRPDQVVHYVTFVIDQLIILNLTQLTGMAREALAADDPGTAAEHILWMERILRFKHDYDIALPTCAECDTSSALKPGRPIRGFLAQFEELSAAIQALLTKGDLSKTIFDGYLSDSRARIFHQAKNIVLLINISLIPHQRVPPSLVSEEIINAHIDCAVVAARGIETTPPTYLSQFCLLHQIPELLAPSVLSHWEAAETAMANQDGAGAVSAVRTAAELLSVVITSLWPLIELMYPARYYAFRENLGATSGSSSASLRGKMLTSAFVKLSERFLDFERQSDEDQAGHRAALAREIGRIRRLLYAWRQLHLALPRNVLGKNGTKSLMGSPDALTAARTMLRVFSNKDPLSDRFGSQTIEPISPPAELTTTADLDDFLLAATGEAARDRFWQVQDRVGPWAKIR